MSASAEIDLQISGLHSGAGKIEAAVAVEIGRLAGAGRHRLIDLPPTPAMPAALRAEFVEKDAALAAAIADNDFVTAVAVEVRDCDGVRQSKSLIDLEPAPYACAVSAVSGDFAAMNAFDCREKSFAALQFADANVAGARPSIFIAGAPGRQSVRTPFWRVRLITDDLVEENTVKAGGQHIVALVAIPTDQRQSVNGSGQARIDDMTRRVRRIEIDERRRG